MDFSCGKGCMTQWGCSWCHNNYCDDTCDPYRLVGKPIYWSENDVYKPWWDTLSEKEKNKLRKKYSKEPPTMKVFFLCNECKNKYIENNICKGRHLDKIGKNKTNF